MSKFTLVVGGNCANGADVIWVHRGAKAGVVCAHWRSEFVTWVFPIGNEESTSHGNYFLYGKQGTKEEALDNAKADYVKRVSDYL